MMKFRMQMLAATLATLLVGCQQPGSGEAPVGAETPAAPATEPATGTATPADLELAVARAILSNPRRTRQARERDSRSKPEVILGLLALKPGQHAIDLFGGTGYYADMMASMVGPQGEVILHNNTAYHKLVHEQVDPRYVENGVAGVTYLKSEADDLRLAPGSLDAALMVMSYHDLYYFEPQRGWGKTDVPLFFSQLHAALKPGGRLLVVDHSALPGTGSTAAQLLHRIDEEFAIRDIESNGFRLIGTSDALRNINDDRKRIVFDPEFRGKTDRFILLFQKD